MKKLFLLLVALINFSASSAQDTIRTKSDTIIGKVVELGIDEIKYKAWDNLNGPVIVIEKRNVIEITYENGKKSLISQDEYEANQEIEIRRKTRCIKFEFLSPLTNDIAFGFETVLKAGMNLEFKAGFIGPGFIPKEELDGEGGFVKVGLKFLTSPTYYRKGVKYAHALKGFYIKPEMIFSVFTNTYTSEYHSFSGPILKKSTVIRYENFAFNIVFGNQQILGNTISLDYYLGLGFGIQNNTSKNSMRSKLSEDYCYSHLFNGESVPFILSGGITIGVPF